MAISKPHLLVVPYPLQGHIIPTVHLSLKLAAAGFSITFLNTEAVHHRLLTSGAARGDIFAGARAAGLDVRYELVCDGLPVDFDRSLYHDEFMAKLLEGFRWKVEAIARRLPALAGLVADTFFVWPATLARSLGIPYVSFWTEPALVFSLYYHMDLLRQNGHFGSQGEYNLARDGPPVRRPSATLPPPPKPFGFPSVFDRRAVGAANRCLSGWNRGASFSVFDRCHSHRSSRRRRV